MRIRTLFCLSVVIVTGTICGEKNQPRFPLDLVRDTKGFTLPQNIPDRHQYVTDWLNGRASHVPAFGPARMPTKQNLGLDGHSPAVAPSRISSAVAIAGESPLSDAPFDTVIIVGGVEDVRHLFERDAMCNVVRWRTQVWQLGEWCDRGRATCTYSPSGLITSRVHEALDTHEIVETWSCSYDDKGRTIADSYNYFLHGALQYFDSASTFYGPDGGVMSWQWESWNQARGFSGHRWIQTSTDTANVYVTARRTSEGWTNESRRTNSWNQSTGTSVNREESWSGSVWENKSLTLSSFVAFDPEEEEFSNINMTYAWTGTAWACSLKGVYRQRVDEWEATDSIFDAGTWEPHQRWSGENSGDYAYQSHTWQTWDHGWVNRWRGITIEESDRTTSIDTMWEEENVKWVWIASRLRDGREIYREDYYASEHVIDQGWKFTRALTATGQDLMIENSSWSQGTWSPAYRYIFSYDSGDRIASIRHEVWSESAWATSHPTPDGNWEYWPNWGTSTTPLTRIGFNGFSELLFRYRTPLTGVEGETGTLPEVSMLRQNYPNPFNPTTAIPFAVSTGARTTIAIYDVLGREVARPLDEWKDPGEYKVQFDASGLASGMYIARFSSGTVTQTKKMVLTR